MATANSENGMSKSEREYYELTPAKIKDMEVISKLMLAMDAGWVAPPGTNKENIDMGAVEKVLFANG